MKSLFITLFVATIYHLQAQSITDSTAIADANMIYDIVDVPAEPIGGMNTFYQTIAKNILYPADARQKNITGKVIVQFVVEKNGELLPENVKVVRTVYKSLDEEAIRVVLLTSPWQRGVKNGEPVRTRKTLPITFNLGGTAPSRK